MLGFIGTEVGMTQAIGLFDVVIKQVSEIGFAGVQQNLGLVAGGLAAAFDTTFLALALSAIANLLTNGFRKKEEDLLSDVEQFTTDNIINKYSSLKGAVTPLAQLAQSSRSDTAEAVLRELRNMHKQQQINAEALLAQLGRVKVIQKFEEQDRKISDWLLIAAGALALFFIHKLWQDHRVRRRIKEMEAMGFQLRWIK